MKQVLPPVPFNTPPDYEEPRQKRPVDEDSVDHCDCCGRVLRWDEVDLGSCVHCGESRPEPEGSHYAASHDAVLRGGLTRQERLRLQCGWVVTSTGEWLPPAKLEEVKP